MMLNRSIKFVSVFADNFHEYVTLKYGSSMLTYFYSAQTGLKKISVI